MKKIIEQWQKISLLKKVVFGLLVIFLGFLGYKYLFSSAKKTFQYQTAKVEKGNLVVSISATGAVSSTNYKEITTSATGVVKKTYVKDGQLVKQGELIAELELDSEGKQKFNQAYASYLSAQNSLEQAKNSLYSAQNELFTNWQTYFNLAQSDRYMGSDGKPKTEERNHSLDFLKTQNDWLSAEANYKLKEKAVKQAEVSLTSSWLSYQQSSPYIYAPISGTLVGFSIQPGMVIDTSTTNSSGDSSLFKIGLIKTSLKPVIVVNLSEVDIPKVKVGDKAIIEFDAIKDKTFIGKVYSLDLLGVSSSGVVSYPVYISLDEEIDQILTKMTANVNIIIETKTDVLMVPNSAVKESETGEKTVQVLKNNQLKTVVIETGLANDEKTEVVSGLNEGETVVVSVIDNLQTNRNTRQTTSPFSGFGGGAGLRINR